MRVPFVKMHGLGNDFVVLDGREAELPPVDATLARALADRRHGIGCDTLVVLGPSGRADFAMRFFNADGSEAGACGNATRAVGRLHGQSAEIETAAGILSVSPAEDGIAVNMGAPRLDWAAIPLAYPLDTARLPLAWDEAGTELSAPVAVNMGNPHAVFFVADCDAVPLDVLGPVIEHDGLFPERVNVNVATIVAPDRIRLRVWERGVGLTLACGTGACATVVAAMRRGLVRRDASVTVSLPGGDLVITWNAEGEVVMTGPATEAFRGSFESTNYGASA